MRHGGGQKKDGGTRVGNGGARVTRGVYDAACAPTQ